MKVAQITAAALGVFLMASPAIFGYADRGAADLHRTVGPFAASLGVVAWWDATRDVRWANIALAAALMVAPILGGHPIAAVLIGEVAGATLAMSTPFAGTDSSDRGSGWRGLLAGARRERRQQQEGAGTAHPVVTGVSRAGGASRPEHGRNGSGRGSRRT